MTNQSEFLRQLFHPDPEDKPAAPPQPTTGPVIPGQERTPDNITENPLRGFTRNLFNN